MLSCIPAQKEANLICWLRGKNEIWGRGNHFDAITIMLKDTNLIFFPTPLGSSNRRRQQPQQQPQRNKRKTIYNSYLCWQALPSSVTLPESECILCFFILRRSLREVLTLLLFAAAAAAAFMWHFKWVWESTKDRQCHHFKRLHQILLAFDCTEIRRLRVGERQRDNKRLLIKIYTGWVQQSVSSLCINPHSEWPFSPHRGSHFYVCMCYNSLHEAWIKSHSKSEHLLKWIHTYTALAYIEV